MVQALEVSVGSIGQRPHWFWLGLGYASVSVHPALGSSTFQRVMSYLNSF